MWEELGISGGTAIIICIISYFIIKGAVKNAILSISDYLYNKFSSAADSQEISKVLQNLIGKKCSICLNQYSNGYGEFGHKILADILEVDTCWIKVHTIEGITKTANTKDKELIIKIADVVNVEINKFK